MLKLFTLWYLTLNGASSNNIQTLRSHRPDLRIYYGRDVIEEQYIFGVILIDIHPVHHQSIFRICTASMIAEEWALTAGHCVDYLMKINFHIWYGNYTESPIKTKLYAKVHKIYFHPGYRRFVLPGPVLHNDISLLRVNKVHMRTFGRILSVDSKSIVGFPVMYLGSGGTEYPGGDLLRPMQLGEAMVIKCEVVMSRKGRNVICIIPKCSNKLNGPWFGDSGGPLLYDGHIIGVASYIDIITNVTIGAYVPVSPYIEWIYQTINN